MKFFIIWKTAFQAITRNKRRSFLTMLGIIIGIASIVTILAVGRGFQADTLKNITDNDDGKIKINVYFAPAGGNWDFDANIIFFSDNDLRMLRNIDGVESVAFMDYRTDNFAVDILVNDKKEFVNVQLVEQSEKNITFGRGLSNSDYTSKNKAALINREMAINMFGSESNALNRGIEIEGQYFNVVGIYEDEDTASDFIFDVGSFGVFNMLIPRPSYRFTNVNTNNNEIVLSIKDGYLPNDVMTEVVAVLEEQGSMRLQGSYEIFDTSMLTEGIGKILSAITYFISAVAGISLFIAGIGIMNMMYISVSERTKEIGIRRALGATKSSIKLQFLLEGVNLSVLGGLLGYLFGMLFAFLIAIFLPFSVTISMADVVVAAGGSALIGLVFSVVPASAAAKKNLIEILN